MQISNNNNNNSQTQFPSGKLRSKDSPSTGEENLLPEANGSAEESPLPLSSSGATKSKNGSGNESFAGELAAVQGLVQGPHPKIALPKDGGTNDGYGKDGAFANDAAKAGKGGFDSASAMMANLTPDQAAKAAAAKATVAASTNPELKFENPKKTIELKNETRLNGVMTDVLSAGPNQAWNGSWVFGADQTEAQALALAKNQKTPDTGSDEKQLQAKLAINSAFDGKIANLEKMLQALGAEEAALNEGTTAGAAAKAEARPVIMSGEDFLQAVQNGAQNGVAKNGSDGAGADTSAEGEMNGNGLRAPSEPFARSSNLEGNFGGAGEANFNAAMLGGLSSGVNGTPGMNGRGNTALRSIPGGQSGKANLTAEDSLAGSNAVGGAKKSGLGQSEGLSSLSELSAQPKLPSFETLSLSQHGGNHTLQSVQSGAAMAAPAVIAGNVIPGSMMKDRLASESVVNFANQISNISKTGMNGKGEMKIRLNPENLGELMIHVSTSGKDVGLKVQATHGDAKKILEESVSSLKDALGSQNLSLSKVEFSVVPQLASQNDAAMNAQTSSGGENRWNPDGSQNPSGRDANDRSNGNSNVRNFQNAQTAFARNPRAGSGIGSTSSSGRLDVTA